MSDTSLMFDGLENGEQAISEWARHLRGVMSTAKGK